MAKKEALPNVHAGLHFPEILVEYGSPAHLNTLIGEDKHRWFKQVVYQTNHRNIERLMLRKESFRQTLRLLLLGAYTEEEPDTTAIVQELSRSCPSLFETLLPRSEIESQILEDDDESLAVLDDEWHKRVKVTGRLQPTYVRNVLHLPSRASKIPQPLRLALTQAFHNDFEMPNERIFGSGPLQWCKKVSFFD
jgi:hypothetical protein